MALFENLQKNISIAGKQAADKAKEVADLTVKTTELRTENQKLQECYARIGKRFYDANKDFPTDEDVIDFNEVEARMDAMQKLEEEIQQLKGKKACPQCGESIDAESKFCNYCGATIE